MKNKKDKFIDKEIINFINWYNKNKKEVFLDEYSSKELINFMEKMAVWYELRYPDYEINRITKGVDEVKNINEEMFYKNEYITNYLNNYNNQLGLKWSNFYNAQAFVSSLSTKESILLEPYRYTDLVYININGVDAHLHLNPNGTIDEAERVGLATRYKVKDYELKGVHIKDLLKLLEKLNIKLSKNNILDNLITLDQNRQYFKLELLKCVMYRIIERGEGEIGVGRAILFSKEFDITFPFLLWLELDSNSALINEYIDIKYNDEEVKQLKLKK